MGTVNKLNKTRKCKLWVGILKLSQSRLGLAYLGKQRWRATIQWRHPWYCLNFLFFKLFIFPYFLRFGPEDENTWWKGPPLDQKRRIYFLCLLFPPLETLPENKKNCFSRSSLASAGSSAGRDELLYQAFSRLTMKKICSALPYQASFKPKTKQNCSVRKWPFWGSSWPGPDILKNNGQITEATL